MSTQEQTKPKDPRGRKKLPESERIIAIRCHVRGKHKKVVERLIANISKRYYR